MISVCIPTFNRYPFLKWTVDRLQRDMPRAEICVSDNCSTDDTRTIRHRTKYACHDENIGAFPNMLAAFQMAERKYAVYCADDDYLIGEEVAKGIEFLEKHPDIAAYCAPCEIYNEMTESTFWNAYLVREPRIYRRRDGMDLFNFLISAHVWPEHMIFRTPVPLKTRTDAYWAFVDLADILESGGIYFAAEPFYRNVLGHPLGDRVQLGNEQCLTHFDQYRAGLEVLACRLFGRNLPYSARHRLQEMISAFICTRLDVARRLHARNGNELQAQMLADRLAIADPRRDQPTEVAA